METHKNLILYILTMELSSIPFFSSSCFYSCTWKISLLFIFTPKTSKNDLKIEYCYYREIKKSYRLDLILITIMHLFFGVINYYNCAIVTLIAALRFR